MKSKNQKAFLTVILFFGLIIFSPWGLAASFDCAKTISQIEKIICNDATLSRLDEDLAVKFRNSIANSPELRQQQIDWLRNSRDKCETVDCLVTAYHIQIKKLDEPQQAQPARPIAETASIQAPVNPVSIFMDMQYFLGSSSLFKEYTWSNPKEKVFGKGTAEWNEQDFLLLEQRLREQIAIERDAVVQHMQQIGLKGSPDENSIFQSRKRYLDEAIAALPKFKYWVSLSQEKLKAEEASQLKIRYEEDQNRQQDINRQEGLRLAQEREYLKRQNEEIKQQQQKDQQQAAVKIQKEEESSQNNLLIFSAIVAAGIGGWFWNKFIRLRCPDCKSVSIDTVNVTETDRWRGTKEVSERNTKGTKTRHVQTTFVKNLYEYRCKNCQHEWSKEKREEL